MTRRLLAVFAHPDDESFGPGGTLAKYAAEGVDVHVVVATDGAAGSVVSDYEGVRDRLAEVRRKELVAAVDILGAHLHVLGYRDSGYIGDPAAEHPQALVNADEDEVTRRVVALIRELKPQVVITHDETGGYFHPDHIKLHYVVTRAFYAAGDADQFRQIGLEPFLPQRLYYTAIPNRWLKAYSFVMRLRGQDPTRVGRNEDIDITSIGRPMDDLHARLNIFPYWETKQKASAMHQSQGGGGGFGAWLPEWLQKRVFGMEYFIQAYPPPTDGVWQRGLFPTTSANGAEGERLLSSQ